MSATGLPYQAADDVASTECEADNATKLPSNCASGESTEFPSYLLPISLTINAANYSTIRQTYLQSNKLFQNCHSPITLSYFFHQSAEHITISSAFMSTHSPTCVKANTTSF
jgi:hypothetical protein